MAVSANMVWEVRGGHSDNNSGGFKPGASGTDYSQQSSPQYTSTTGSAAGAGAVISTPLAAADMVGNTLRVVSGTLALGGVYEIISVVPGVSITLETTVVNGASSNIAFNIGGAVGSIGRVATATANLGAVAGNTIWVRGTFTMSTTDVVSCNGSLLNPIKIIGYNVTRGDGYLGRTNGNGPLITTNMPAVNYNATQRMTVTGTFIIFESIRFTGTVAAQVINLPADGVIQRCRVENASTNALANAVDILGRGLILNSDLLLSGGSGGLAVVKAGANQFYRIIGNRINGPGVGIGVTSSSNIVIVGNTIFAGTIPLSVTVTGVTLTVINNTLVGGSGDGISVAAGQTSPWVFLNNLVTDNGGYGFNFNSNSGAHFLSNNRTRDNALGAVNPVNTWAMVTNYEAETTDTGGPETDYVNAGANDYRLLASSPAVAAALPQFLSAGALQPEASAGEGGQKSYAFST